MWRSVTISTRLSPSRRASNAISSMAPSPNLIGDVSITNTVSVGSVTPFMGKIGRAIDPDHRLADTVRDVLAYSDTHLKAADLKAVAELVIAVAEAVFHRELHAEVDWSPLADDPETFLAPLRASLTFRAVAAPAGALHEEAGAASATVVSAAGTAPMASTRSESLAGHDPHRLLVISDGNLHFAEGILRDLEAHAHVEIRRLMLRESGTRFGRRDTASMIVDRLGEAVGRDVPSPSEKDAALLDWPDTVLVDWCDNAAMWRCSTFADTCASWCACTASRRSRINRT